MSTPYRATTKVVGETGASFSLVDVLDAALCRLPVHIAIHRRDGAIVYLNSAVAEALEIDRSAAIGRRVGELERRSVELASDFEDHLKLVFEIGRESSMFMTIPTKHGLRDFEVTLTPWFSSDGSAVEFVIVAGTDVTALESRVARPETLQTSHTAGESDKEGQELTARQTQILRLTAQGKSAKEIAQIIGISVRTVESHKSVLIRKIGAATRSAYFEYATKHGYL